MITRLFEVCITVSDFDAAVEKYSGVLDMAPIMMKAGDIPFPGLKVAIFIVGDISLSVIGSDQEDSLAADFLRDKREGISLICLEVTDIEQTMRELSKKGVKFSSEEPLPYIAGRQAYSLPESMHGVPICWAQHDAHWDVAESPRKLWGSG